VWIEPPPERGDDDEVEDEGVDDEDEDAKEKAGRDEGSNPGRLRVDLRNCAALVRLVGVRTAALEGRLEVDLAGCASLPSSARPPKKESGEETRDGTPASLSRHESPSSRSHQ
jgi:hypothetical protein